MRESRIPLWESGFHAFLASRLLNAGELAEVAQVEHQPKLEGRQMIMVLAPKKKK